MASWQEICIAQQMVCLITLGDDEAKQVKFSVTRRLLSTDESAKRRLKGRIDLAKDFEKLVADAQEAMSTGDAQNGLSTLMDLKSQLAVAKTELAMDVRQDICYSIHDHIADWDLTDGKVKVPLDPEKLYKTEIPTALLEQILTKTLAVDVVPK